MVTTGSAKESSLEETSPAVSVTTRKNKRLPRKHFFSILCHFSAWLFHNPPSSYKDSPFFNLDEKLFMPQYTIKNETLKNTEIIKQVPGQTKQVVKEAQEKDEVTKRYLPQKALRPGPVMPNDVNCWVR